MCCFCPCVTNGSLGTGCLDECLRPSSGQSASIEKIRNGFENLQLHANSSFVVVQIASITDGMSKASKTKQPKEGTAASAEATDRNQLRALQPRGSIDYVEVGAREIRGFASLGGWSSRGHQPTSRKAPNLKPSLGKGQYAVAGAVESAWAQLPDAQAGSGNAADGLGHDCPLPNSPPQSSP